MKSLLDNVWIILTVAIPGLVFYTTFEIWTNILGLNIDFFSDINESATIFVAFVIALGFIIQLVGIVIEDIAFKHGFYLSKKVNHENIFENKEIIISDNCSGNTYYVERILAQFFMSNNIATSFVLNSLGMVIYVFFENIRIDSIIVITFIVLFLLTIGSFYVSRKRCNISYNLLKHINDQYRLY